MTSNAPQGKDLAALFRESFRNDNSEILTVQEFLEEASVNPSVYDTVDGRLLRAIGDPVIVDTSKDAALGPYFENQIIKIYPKLDQFFDFEIVNQRFMMFLEKASQGLEESKQIPVFLGPPGVAKSDYVKFMLNLFEQVPFYTLMLSDDAIKEMESDDKTAGVPKVSPIFESPLGLFCEYERRALIEEKFKIPSWRIPHLMSPWAAKRLYVNFRGDLSKFRVVKMYPSLLRQIGVAVVEAQDQSVQDVSDLVGSIDLNKVRKYSTNDTDAYNYSGGLNLTTQGLQEFREFHRAQESMLNPLYGATQDRSYRASERLPLIPYYGRLLTHSNLDEFKKFESGGHKGFIDRATIIRVPYVLRETAEVEIIRKMLKESSLDEKRCAPETIRLLARFIILTRLKEQENVDPYTKLRVYDRQKMRDIDPKAASFADYRKNAGLDEGMDGLSTRFEKKVLGTIYNVNPTEKSANPVDLFYHLEKAVEYDVADKKLVEKYKGWIQKYLRSEYKDYIGKRIRMSLRENSDRYAQQEYETYILFADRWEQGEDTTDPVTGANMTVSAMNKWLEEREKAAGISNPKQVRSDAVKFDLRERRGKDSCIPWSQNPRLAKVIEKYCFDSVEYHKSILASDATRTSDQEKDRKNFLERFMKAEGISELQAIKIANWYANFSKED